MKTHTLLALGIGLVVAGTPEVCHAGYVAFCIYHTANYTDDDANEAPHDYWTDDPPKEARGAVTGIYMDLYYTVFAGHLGDGLGGTSAGCTPPILLPAGSHFFEIYTYSEGEVAGHHITVTGGTYPNDAVYGVSVATVVNVDPFATQVVPLAIAVQPGWAFDTLNVYQAAAWAISRHDGGLTDEPIKYRVIPDDPQLTPNIFYCEHTVDHPRCPTAETVILERAFSTKKFLIAHETGHWIGDLRTQYVMDSDTIDVSLEGEDPCFSAGVTHGMKSEEWVGAALGEGFGYFYSADTWNNHNGGDCGLQVGASNIDCQNGSQDFPLAWFANFCSGAGFGLSGSELDWMRALWDVHTRGAAPDPSFNQIMSWLDAAGSWSKFTAFTELDQEAGDVGGELEANWLWAVDENGLDP